MEVYNFATLKVVAMEDGDAYLEWGHPQELYLPAREQEGSVYVGDDLVVFITLDRDQRPMASMRLDDFLDHDASLLKENQKVDLLVIGESDIGFEAIIDSEHLGVLYRSEVFQPLGYGTRVPGYIKKIREDGKIDLILQPIGSKGSGDLGERILAQVRDRGGFLPMTDKSDPNLIYSTFGVSKNKFKMALGNLYKNRKVSLDPDGVRLGDRDRA